MIFHTARRMKSFQKHKASEKLLSQRYLNGHGHKTNARCCVYGMRLLFSGPFNSFCVKLFLLWVHCSWYWEVGPDLWDARKTPVAVLSWNNVAITIPRRFAKHRDLSKLSREILGIPLRRLSKKIRFNNKINRTLRLVKLRSSFNSNYIGCSLAYRGLL